MPIDNPARRHDLDWVRIAAFGLLILYHVGMYYVSWDWHVKSPAASSAIEPLMMLSSPWRLALLFLVSGAATGLLLARRPAGFAAALEKAKIESPRGSFTLGKNHNPVQDFYLRQVVGKENKVVGIASKALADPGRGCRM